MKITAKIIIIPTVLATVLLSGCASTYRQPLTVSNRTQIGSDKMVVNTRQREIKSELNFQRAESESGGLAPVASDQDYNAVPTSAGLVGALVGTLIVTAIDSHRVRSAHKAIVPVRSTLNNFDFTRLLMQQLRSHVTNIPWLHVKRSTLKFDVNVDEKKNIIESSRQKSALFVGVQYVLNHNFNVLSVNANVELDKRDITTDSGYKVLYRNRFVFVDHLPKRDRTRQQSVAAWTANKGALLKQTLRKAARSIANMIAIDIRNPHPKPYAKLQTAHNLRFRNEHDYSVSGKVVKRNRNFYTLRLHDQSLYTVNRLAVIR